MEPSLPAVPPAHGEILLSREVLLGLAPIEAIRPRKARLVEHESSLSIRDVPRRDREILEELYRFISDLNHQAVGSLERPCGDMKELLGFLATNHYSTVIDRCSELGARLEGVPNTEALRLAYHDIRGGSLVALIAHLDLIELGQAQDEDVDRIRILSRDHCKIMRNIIPDIDPVARARDLELRYHRMDLLREKWAKTSYQVADDPSGVTVHSDFSGAVADCCMEFSALDRVIYNLINNASRYSADRSIQLHILALDDAKTTNLRIVVANKIGPRHRQALETRFNGNMSQLFAGGFTTGGNGLGMRICADCVAHGYGLSSPDEARENGYLGAKLVADYFVAWFHWPARRDLDDS